MKQGYLLRMPAELKEKLAQSAARTGISINALILQILWRYADDAAS